MNSPTALAASAPALAAYRDIAETSGLSRLANQMAAEAAAPLTRSITKMVAEHMPTVRLFEAHRSLLDDIGRRFSLTQRVAQTFSVDLARPLLAGITPRLPSPSLLDSLNLGLKFDLPNFEYPHLDALARLGQQMASFPAVTAQVRQLADHFNGMREQLEDVAVADLVADLVADAAAHPTVLDLSVDDATVACPRCGQRTRFAEMTTVQWDGVSRSQWLLCRACAN